LKCGRIDEFFYRKETFWELYENVSKIRNEYPQFLEESQVECVLEDVYKYSVWKAGTGIANLGGVRTARKPGFRALRKRRRWWCLTPKM